MERSEKLIFEIFIAHHRNAYVSMQQCAKHVDFQLPNEHTCITYIIDGIQCNCAPLQSAMSLVRNYTMIVWKMNEFEATALYLLPHEPLSKKLSARNKRGVAEISDTYVANTTLTSASKPAMGKKKVEVFF